MKPARRSICEADPLGADALALLHLAAIEARALYPEFFVPGSPAPTNEPTLPRGSYLLGHDAGRAVACAALRPIDDTSAELRRMFVVREVRRQGWARALLAAIEERALRAGFDLLRLETGCRQQPAMALYKAAGFVRIPPFGPYRDDPTSRCYEKRLRLAGPHTR